MGLIETKVKHHKYASIHQKLLPHWNSKHNGDHDPRGRIWILWDSNFLTVDSLDTSDQLQQSDITDITDFLYAQELDDLATKGGHFTWSNKSAGTNRTLTKIDRCFDNPAWRSSFKDSFAEIHIPGVSDHSPIVIRWRNVTSKPKSFKYFNHWADHDTFKPLIESIWKTPVEGNPMMKLTAKLKLVKYELRFWSKKYFSQISDRTAKAKHDLEKIQHEIQARPLDPQLAQMELDASAIFFDLARQEEASLYQMVKQKNVLLGDGNNNYFHNLVKGRKSANTILSVRNLNGDLAIEEQEVANTFLDYYQHLLAETHPNPLFYDDMENMQFPHLGNTDDLFGLAKDVSRDEIKYALF
ncbi:Dnase i-like superfamily protein [Thalictrum thalictroides]|uniref:Dnase i-like superfamily protein n=1 Tax=Thalictrum thalictroides TaxID=46969 RepID=A0A7J6X6I5_THATH|nr:Dnase i-like superfamily protein [Thalictrum thalictroides]